VKTNQYDEIHIRDLLVRCIIGINPEEREKEQDVVFNITLFADLDEACSTDRLEKTVDYKDIKNRIMETAKAACCGLLEKLAQLVAEVCLESPKVRKVRVVVDKPGALRFARSVAVEIVREE